MLNIDIIIKGENTKEKVILTGEMFKKILKGDESSNNLLGTISKVEESERLLSNKPSFPGTKGTPFTITFNPSLT